MIGDGAGVGKGRQLAGIILDAWMQGHKRHLWLSISPDLCGDSERDLRCVRVCVYVFWVFHASIRIRGGEGYRDSCCHDLSRRRLVRENLHTSDRSDRSWYIYLPIILSIYSRSSTVVPHLAFVRGCAGSVYSTYPTREMCCSILILKIVRRPRGNMS